MVFARDDEVEGEGSPLSGWQVSGEGAKVEG